MAYYVCARGGRYNYLNSRHHDRFGAAQVATKRDAQNLCRFYDDIARAQHRKENVGDEYCERNDCAHYYVCDEAQLRGQLECAFAGETFEDAFDKGVITIQERDDFVAQIRQARA